MTNALIDLSLVMLAYTLLLFSIDVAIKLCNRAARANEPQAPESKKNRKVEREEP